MKFVVLKKEYFAFDVLFALIVLTLPFSYALPNIFLLFAFLVFLFNKNKEKTNLYSKATILLALFLVLKAFLSNELIENFYLYKHIITFTAISILAFNIKDRSLVKKGFVFGVLFAVLFTIIQIVIYFLKYSSIPLGNTSEVIELLIVHRPYFGFICFLGILCSTDLINRAKNTKELIIYKTLIPLFIVFIYLIAARLALGLVIIYLFVIVVQRVRLSKKKVIPLLGVFISLILLFVINNENLKKRLHIQDTFNNTVKVISNQEPRVVIWECVFKLIKKPNFNYFIGYNDIKTIQLDLNECYKSTIKNVSKNEYYLETKFNTHNQFFDFFLQGGVIGITLFLLIFCCAFYLCRSNSIVLLVLFSFLLFLIVENLFHRQMGVYLIGIFIPLFIKRKTDNINGG